MDYAIWFAGAATVPVYETSSAEQIGWILADSGARAAVTETADHSSRVKEVRDSLSGPAPRVVHRGQRAGRPADPR